MGEYKKVLLHSSKWFNMNVFKMHRVDTPIQIDSSFCSELHLVVIQWVLLISLTSSGRKVEKILQEALFH